MVVRRSCASRLLPALALVLAVAASGCSHEPRPGMADDRKPVSVRPLPLHLGEARTLLGVDDAGRLIWSSGLWPSVATPRGGVITESSARETGIEWVDGSGHVRWKRHIGPCLRGFAVDPSGNVYVGCGKTLLALAPNGRLRWQSRSDRYLVDGFAFSPGGIYVEGMLASESADGPDAVWALSPAGALRWASTVDKLSDVDYSGLGDETGSISAMAAGPDGTLYVAAGGYLTAVSPAGRPAWRYDMPADTDETSAIVIGRDGTIYAVGWDTFSLGEDGGYVQALTPDGHRTWSATTDDGFDSAVLTPDGRLYATTGSHVLRFRTP
jgi:PQQ-like domain